MASPEKETNFGLVSKLSITGGLFFVLVAAEGTLALVGCDPEQGLRARKRKIII